MSVQAAAKHLTFIDETEASPLPPVMADPARAKQVLINLLSNSVKFTDKGWITLRARSFPERGFVELEIQDTGIGIAPAKQQHLFEKFHQLDSTFTRQQGGSGLGLSICRSLVEMMGGRIKLMERGRGLRDHGDVLAPRAAGTGRRRTREGQGSPGGGWGREWR